MPITTPHSPSTAPRLKSMPSVRMTSVIPSDTMISAAHCSAMFERLRAERNSGLASAKPAASSANR